MPEAGRQRMPAEDRPRIVFWGTPEFALPVLEALCANYNVILCVTKADKPKGRGGRVTKSPVRILAEEKQIPVLAPESIRTDEFFGELAAHEADFYVTCAYGKIIPGRILELPRMGCVNVHASLLPKLRGSAPIWRAIMDGEKETGVTTMMTDAGMDTGDILLAKSLEIGENMTCGELSDALSVMGAGLIVETIDGLLEGRVKRIPQDHEAATFAPPIRKEEGLIDWTRDARSIHDLVRGMDPTPGAFSFLHDAESGKVEKIKIWKTALPCESADAAVDIPGGGPGDAIGGKPGGVLKIGKNRVAVICGGSQVLSELQALQADSELPGLQADSELPEPSGRPELLELLEIQAENSKRMAVAAFLNGHELKGTFRTEG